MIGRSLFKRLATFRKNESGVAVIEFAFVAPIFLVLVVTGLELSNYALSHLRVSQMAMTVADDAGRVTSGIDEANIYEVFAGAEIIGGDLAFEDNGRIVLSSLEDNGRTGSDAGQTIRWQRCWGDLEQDSEYGNEGIGRDDNALENGMGRGSNQIEARKSTALMFVEVVYNYQSLLNTSFFTPPPIRYESAFNVRGRQNNDISNSQALVVLDCA